MSVSKQIKRSLRRSLSRLHRDRPALLTFLFHSLFDNQQEIQLKRVDPQQCITRDHMREFIVYFQDAGYRFVGPQELTDELAREGKYILITFDDGYFNNLRMLEVMEERQVPAVFFITTDNIQQEECFWWDVVYRERSKQGKNRSDISLEQKSLKKLHHRDIRSYLLQHFGNDCFKPWSDTDRPMTVAELQRFATHPLVTIGNHTAEHYLLDQYTDNEVSEQIERGQTELKRMLGSSPRIIAYPNGNYSQAAIDASRRAGLQIGITVDKRKNYLPIHWPTDDAFKLGRFVLWGTEDIRSQCDIFRSDIRL